jgi:hypothetical protein
MRELRFALTIDSTSLLCPNAQEFYAKSYLTSDIADNFRTLPNIKYKTEIATTTFTNILSASTCAFSSGTNPLISIPIDVCAVSAMAEICRFDLEQSFVSMQMVKGSNGSYEVASFMNFYWDVMAKEIQEEIEIIRWRGNTAATGGTYVSLCDGHEKKLLADGTVNKISKAAITNANVLAEMAKVYASMATNAPSLINKTADLRLYVAPNVAAAYRQAVAAGNNTSYLTKNLDLTYLDIKIVVAQGMSADKMVLTLKDNMIYAFDAEGDSTALKAIDLSDTTAEPKLRTRANMKIGFFHTNGAEIVYYN